MTTTTRRHQVRHQRGERGSAVIEAVVGVPAFMLFVLLIIAGGRLAIAQQAVEAAAADAARAASIARTQDQARTRRRIRRYRHLDQPGTALPVAAGDGGRQRVRRPGRHPGPGDRDGDLRRGPVRPGPPRPPGQPDHHRHPVLTDRHLPGALTHDIPTTPPQLLRLRSERGSISAWMALAATAMIILAGLAVDLGGQVYTRQHAIDIATQAARAGGQQLQAPRRAPRCRGADRPGPGGRGGPGLPRRLRYVRHGPAARRHHRLVTTTAHYDTKFLSIIGIDQITVTGTGESRTVRAVHGNER